MTAGPAAMTALLQALPLFSRVEPDQLGTLARRTRGRRLGRGEVLFRQGDPATSFFVVVDGVVKVRLQGACAGCPMSQMTLRNGIEKVLKEEIPEVKAVEPA